LSSAFLVKKLVHLLMDDAVAGYVPLPAIVKKVVSDHAGSSLGEFRHVILAMLDTYSYDTAIHR
ncbi:unnamed protein product, partial [Ectocarpus sp. 12 AP-2014]